MTLWHQIGTTVEADTRFEAGRKLADQLGRDGIVMTVLDWRVAVDFRLFDSPPELWVDIPGQEPRWIDQRSVRAATARAA